MSDIEGAVAGIIAKLQAERDAAIARAEKAEGERGSDTGHDCDICRQRIFGTMIGNGDGTGQRFAHPGCYYRSRMRDAEASLAAVTAERDKLRENLHSRNAAIARAVEDGDVAILPVVRIERHTLPPALKEPTNAE